MIWTHVSELAIDRMLAGEVAAVDAIAIADHAADCTRCRSLLDDAYEVKRAFAMEPPLDLPIPMIRRRRPAAYIAPLLAAAAAFVFVWWPRSEPEVVRTKGSSLVGFYVAHDDATRVGNTREVVTPGDRIQLFTTTQHRTWIAVIGEDAAANRTLYVEPRAVDAGREQLVPLSITLDATLGDEVVTTVFCSRQFDANAIPADCTTDRFTLVKVPR